MLSKNNRIIYQHFSRLALLLSLVIGSFGINSTASATDVAFTLDNVDPFTIEFDKDDFEDDEFYVEVNSRLTFLDTLIFRWDQVSIDTSKAPGMTDDTQVQVDFFVHGVSWSATQTSGTDYFELAMNFFNMERGAMDIIMPWDNFNTDNDFTLTVCANTDTCSAVNTNPVPPPPNHVPVPAAAWLFGTGIISLIGFSRRKKV